MVPMVFPVPDVKDVAQAAGEVFARINNGNVTEDMSLLVNQVEGCASFALSIVFGTPKAIVGKAPTKIETIEVTDEQIVEGLKFMEEHGLPKAGDNTLYISILLAVLRKAVDFIPEPYGPALKALLDALS